jgi:hypothetical protein
MLTAPLRCTKTAATLNSPIDNLIRVKHAMLLLLCSLPM